jgi:hypothetical protein
MSDNKDSDKTAATKEEEEETTTSTTPQEQLHQEQERHACEIQVTFPTDLQAEQAMKILQVDAEPTDRVTKSFRLHEETNEKETLVSMIV